MRTVAFVCLAAALAAHAPVQAQAAASAPAASASAAESAMERARRQAASPLRAILEASKARRRPGDGEAAEPAEAPIQRTVNTRAAPQTSAAADAGGPAARAAATPVVVADPPAVPDTPISTQLTLSSDALQELALRSPMPALDRVGAAPAPGALPAPAAALPAPAAVTPKLISMVEPALAARTLEEAGRLNELPVELTIRPDGTVAQVAVLANAPRQLVRAVVLALEQWRFEPLPAERVHRVQLVFNNTGR